MRSQIRVTEFLSSLSAWSSRTERLLGDSRRAWRGCRHPRQAPFTVPISASILMGLALLGYLLGYLTTGGVQAEEKVPAVLRFSMQRLNGKPIQLAEYHGRVILFVNVASECGLTPQYQQLQALHQKYHQQGLAVVGVPCNQFGQQEPGSADEIQAFCQQNYGVTFDLLAKVEVNGPQACGLYKYLQAAPTKPKGAGEVSWNFEKFIVNRRGEVVARFDADTEPTDPELVRILERELAKK